MKTAQMTRDERRRYLRKILEQRIMGLVLLACCGLMLWLCSTGQTPEEQDATAVVMLAPLGLWMLFTKQIVIY